jgi:hypothetical protein
MLRRSPAIEIRPNCYSNARVPARRRPPAQQLEALKGAMFDFPPVGVRRPGQ